MRVVFWNIRAGGGVRAAAIARQIAAWEADAVALAEFRGTSPSGELAPPRRGGRTHEPRRGRPRRGGPRVQRDRGGRDAGARRGGLDRRLPPPAGRRARLPLVLPERRHRLPDRPGLPQPRAPAPPAPLPLRLGPPFPPHRKVGERPRGHAARPEVMALSRGG